MGLEIHYSRGRGDESLFDRLRNFNFGPLSARWIKKRFQFKNTATTSRGTLNEKFSYFILIHESSEPNFMGIGECAPLSGLSPELNHNFEKKLDEVCDNIHNYESYLSGGLDDYSSILFGLETALLDLDSFGNKILFPSKFTEGIEPIHFNGLIWMGDPDFMVKQINEKLENGFNTIKLKVGNNRREEELFILEQLRSNFSEFELEIRLDANGAFKPSQALRIIEEYANFQIHSIEQPIKPGNWEDLSEICRESPVPIALDEELIGISDYNQKSELIETTLPHYLILKPTLCGGIQGAEEWIAIAEEYNIGWWATSALESNLGLNAIAQWVFTNHNPLPQGLGTGQLFEKNFKSPLYSSEDDLYYDPSIKWDLSYLFDLD